MSERINSTEDIPTTLKEFGIDILYTLLTLGIVIGALGALTALVDIGLEHSAELIYNINGEVRHNTVGVLADPHRAGHAFLLSAVILMLAGQFIPKKSAE